MDNKTYCYLIKAGNSIKIGYSKDVDKRVSDIQCGNACRVDVIAKFPFDTKEEAAALEKHLHKKYKKHQIRREWFRAGPILNNIQRQNQGSIPDTNNLPEGAAEHMRAIMGTDYAPKTNPTAKANVPRTDGQDHEEHRQHQP